MPPKEREKDVDYDEKQAENNMEMHMPGYHFNGPGTNLRDRLTERGGYERGHDDQPINKVDNIAFRHDFYYTSPNPLVQIRGDEEMIKDLEALPSKEKGISATTSLLLIALKKSQGELLLKLGGGATKEQQEEFDRVVPSIEKAVTIVRGLGKRDNELTDFLLDSIEQGKDITKGPDEEDFYKVYKKSVKKAISKKEIHYNQLISDPYITDKDKNEFVSTYENTIGDDEIDENGKFNDIKDTAIDSGMNKNMSGIIDKIHHYITGESDVPLVRVGALPKTETTPKTDDMGDEVRKQLIKDRKALIAKIRKKFRSASNDKELNEAIGYARQNGFDELSPEVQRFGKAYHKRMTEPPIGGADPNALEKRYENVIDIIGEPTDSSEGESPPPARGGESHPPVPVDEPINQPPPVRGGGGRFTPPEPVDEPINQPPPARGGGGGGGGRFIVEPINQSQPVIKPSVTTEQVNGNLRIEGMIAGADFVPTLDDEQYEIQQVDEFNVFQSGITQNMTMENPIFVDNLITQYREFTDAPVSNFIDEMQEKLLTIETKLPKGYRSRTLPLTSEHDMTSAKSREPTQFFAVQELTTGKANTQIYYNDFSDKYIPQMYPMYADPDTFQLKDYNTYALDQPRFQSTLSEAYY